jgi:glycosyltransferase involved in cell wall biosynthesis
MNELNWHGPINRLGYGTASSNLVYSLSKFKHISLFPIGPIEIPHNQWVGKAINEALEHASFADYNATTVKVWHQNQLIERVGNGRYYGFPIFELNKFTGQELNSLRCPHELIVCSHWAKDVLESCITSRINVVPLGVDGEIFYSGEKPNQKTYKFFTMGKWEVRKGHDFIIECFNKAFEDDDDVELHMATFNPFFQGQNEFKAYEWNNLAKSAKLGHKTVVHGPFPTHLDVANFIRSMDCGLFPSRAEGWNLELLESMACGKPVIATNYSAHTEYCTSKNAFLLDIELLTEANDGIWFHGQGEWAFLGQRHKTMMIDYMRHCYKERPTNLEGVKTAKEFSWSNSATKLMEAIR